MRNRVRFFIDKDRNADTEYWDIPIPLPKSIVFLHTEMFQVKKITYEYGKTVGDYNIICVYVEHMEDEDY